MRFRSIVLVVVAVLIATPCLAAKPKISVMSVGDSWAEGWCDDLEFVLKLNGHQVDMFNKGIPATTAMLWVQPGALTDVKLNLITNPQIEWLMLSLGGNDLFDGYLLMGYGDALFPLVDGWLRQIIDELLATAPHLNISLNGYDFPNFEHCVECILMGQAALGGNTYTQNLLIAELTYMAQEIAGDYPQVHAVDLLGTLQEAGGVPFAPNFYRPSPADYFPGADCIHPSDGGWRIIMHKLYDEFFTPILEGDDDDDVTDDDDNDTTDDDDVTDGDDTTDDDDFSDDDFSDDSTDDDDAGIEDSGDMDNDSGSNGCGW